MSEQRRQSSDSPAGEEDSPRVVSEAPSILRNAPGSRQFLADSPSVVISLPDVDQDNWVGESLEQLHRRRIRFLEMRREHYSQMHQHTEQCTMSEDEEQEVPKTSPPEAEDKNKPK